VSLTWISIAAALVGNADQARPIRGVGQVQSRVFLLER